MFSSKIGDDGVLRRRPLEVLTDRSRDLGPGRGAVDGMFVIIIGPIACGFPRHGMLPSRFKFERAPVWPCFSSAEAEGPLNVRASGPVRRLE